MKKFLAILLVLLCGAASLPAKDLQFMGIELNGSPEAFKSKFLRISGMKFDGITNDCYTFTGPYAGYEGCEFYLFSNDNGIVNNMDVYLPKASSWRQIKRQYKQIVNEFKADSHFTLYEEVSTFESPYSEGDGDEMQAVESEKCDYHALFTSTEGYVKVSISKYRQVYIIFYDFDDSDNSSSSSSSSSSNGGGSSYSSNSGALTVLGLPIEGSARQFCNRLINEKGCRLVDDDDPEWISLRGTFTGKSNSEIYLVSEGSTFTKVIIFLPELSTWKDIRRQYLEYKASYDAKYTVDSEMAEFRNGYREGDGREVEGVKADECYYITNYKAPGGHIMLLISKYMQLEVIYTPDSTSSGNITNDI